MKKNKTNKRFRYKYFKYTEKKSENKNAEENKNASHT
jgi:hypothetical protein